MTTFLTVAAVLFFSISILLLIKYQRLRKVVTKQDAEIAAVKQESQNVRLHYESEANRIHAEAHLAISETRKSLEQQIVQLNQESERIRQHYGTETNRVQVEAHARIAEMKQELERLRSQFQSETQRSHADAQLAMAETQKFLEQQIAQVKQESERIQEHYELEALRARTDAERVIANGQKSVEEQILDLKLQIQQRYETESSRVQTEAHARVAEMKQELERLRLQFQSEADEAKRQAQSAVTNSQNLTNQKLDELKRDAERIRQHYENEARKAKEAVDAVLAKTLQEFEPLRRFESLRDAENEIKKLLSVAISEANALRDEANTLLNQSQTAAAHERSEAAQKAKEIRRNADALLDRATRDAGLIVEDATKRAEQIGGDAYIALRDKETLEKAVGALWNVVSGYGDRYVIPTRSVLDELASDFDHTEAGESLKHAREQSRRIVEERHAAACNYVEEDRRDRANRFVVDAFNGRVDAILSRTKHDNYGTLEQEIRDAYALVNLNGIAFRDARILPVYLDARLAELKWAVIVQELRMKAREEQRRIQEQIREEEKVRREQERAIKEAQEREDVIQKALTQARAEAEQATAQERTKFDAQIAELTQRLVEAEAIKQREISMAQLTRAGNVYIISNIGSFGEEIFKIGMTRRREPMDRIWELSDASVPFDFDVHAMIHSDDAPTLERMLHEEFDNLRVNQVNYRKEFFKLPLERIKTFVTKKNLNASFTMLADAHEYKETQALLKMTPEQREKYQLRQAAEETFASD